MGQAWNSAEQYDWKNSWQFVWKNSFQDILNHEVKNKVFMSIIIVGKEMSWSKQCHGAD